MGNLVYPTLAGLDFGVSRSVMAPPVAVKTTPSLREYRARNSSYTRYEYSLSYEFLRTRGVWTELQSIVGFFNLVGGPFDSFLFKDPDDNATAGEQFAVADGTTRSFQLVRAYGGFAEAVYDVFGTTQVFDNGAISYGFDRTNLFSFSQAFDNAYWTKSDTVVTADSTTAPDSTTTADTLAEDAVATVSHWAGHTIACTAGVAYTFSAYFKATGTGSARVAQLFFPSSAFGSNLVASMDMSGNTNANSGSQISVTSTNVGGGWWRMSATAVATATASGSFRLYLSTSLTLQTPAYTGDGVSGLYVWGAQLEAATAATTYIPTVASAVTVPAAWALNSAGLVTFTTAPLVGHLLTWTGNFYHRCRFKDSELSADKFMDRLWSMRKVQFMTVQA